MKYVIHAVQSLTENLSALSQQYKNSFVFFYEINSACIMHLYRARDGNCLTKDFRRKVNISYQPSLSRLKKIKAGEMILLRSSDALKLMQRMKSIQKNRKSFACIFAMNNQLLVQAYHNENIETKLYNNMLFFEQLASNHIPMLEKCISSSDFHKLARAIVRQEPAFNTIYKQLASIKNVTVSAETFGAATVIGHIMKNAAKNVIHTVMRVNPNADFENISISPVIKARDIKKVLVISNLAGSHLEHLNAGLDYFTKGEPGFIWKHLYGNFTSDRLQHEIYNKHYDLIIYRGHGLILQSRLTYPLGDGSTFAVTGRPARYMLHLACLEKKDQSELQHYPCSAGIFPAAFLQDYDDAATVQKLLQHYAESRNFENSALNAIQDNLSLNYWVMQ